MIKEMLVDYMGYKAGIKIKENKIKKIEQEEISVSSPNLEINGDIKPKGYVKSNDEEKIIKNIDTVNKLKKEIEELQSKIDIVDSLISTLNDYYRQVIELKYKYNKNDMQIAIILNKQSDRAIRYAVKVALKKMEKKYNNFS